MAVTVSAPYYPREGFTNAQLREMADIRKRTQIGAYGYYGGSAPPQTQARTSQARTRAEQLYQHLKSQNYSEAAARAAAAAAYQEIDPYHAVPNKYTEAPIKLPATKGISTEQQKTFEDLVYQRTVAQPSAGLLKGTSSQLTWDIQQFQKDTASFQSEYLTQKDGTWYYKSSLTPTQVQQAEKKAQALQSRAESLTQKSEALGTAITKYERAAEIRNVKAEALQKHQLMSVTEKVAAGAASREVAEADRKMRSANVLTAAEGGVQALATGFKYGIPMVAEGGVATGKRLLGSGFKMIRENKMPGYIPSETEPIYRGIMDWAEYTYTYPVLESLGEVVKLPVTTANIVTVGVKEVKRVWDIPSPEGLPPMTGKAYAITKGMGETGAKLAAAAPVVALAFASEFDTKLTSSKDYLEQGKYALAVASLTDIPIRMGIMYGGVGAYTYGIGEGVKLSAAAGKQVTEYRAFVATRSIARQQARYEPTFGEKFRQIEYSATGKPTFKIIDKQDIKSMQQAREIYGGVKEGMSPDMYRRMQFKAYGEKGVKYVQPKTWYQTRLEQQQAVANTKKLLEAADTVRVREGINYLYGKPPTASYVSYPKLADTSGIPRILEPKLQAPFKEARYVSYQRLADQPWVDVKLLKKPFEFLDDLGEKGTVGGGRSFAAERTFYQTTERIKSTGLQIERSLVYGYKPAFTSISKLVEYQSTLPSPMVAEQSIAATTRSIAFPLLIPKEGVKELLRTDEAIKYWKPYKPIFPTIDNRIEVEFTRVQEDELLQDLVTSKEEERRKIPLTLTATASLTETVTAPVVVTVETTKPSFTRPEIQMPRPIRFEKPLRPEEPEVPEEDNFNTLYGGKKKKKGRERLPKIGGYDVYVKMRGQFKTVGKGLSISSAMAKGIQVTQMTPARSFKVVPRGASKEARGMRLPREPRYYEKKGTMIEKTRYAIDTAGEVAGISMKGGKRRRVRII